MKCYIEDCEEEATTIISTKDFCQKHYRRYSYLVKGQYFKKDSELAYKYFLLYPNPEFFGEDSKLKEFIKNNEKIDSRPVETPN